MSVRPSGIVTTPIEYSVMIRLIGIRVLCTMLTADSIALEARNQTGRKTSQNPNEVRTNSDLPRKPNTTT